MATTMTQPPKQQKKPAFATTYILGGLSACTAECVVYPFDIVKTRMQISTGSSLNKHTPNTSFATVTSILKHEGVSGFYTGITAAWIRQFIYSGVRFGAYEMLREKFFGRSEDGTFSPWKSGMAGMTAGAIGQFAASPTDLVKVQLQVDGLHVARGQPRLYRGFYHCGRTLFATLGVRGMWKGWAPNCQRAALVQLGDLTAYDTAKQTMLLHTDLGDTKITHGISSIIAGFVATVMSTPSDVVKTRMMNEPDRYKSTMHCLRRTVADEGFLALYKGFFPIWARMGPKAIVLYMTFEQLRSMAGLSSW